MFLGAGIASAVRDVDKLEPPVLNFEPCHSLSDSGAAYYCYHKMKFDRVTSTHSRLLLLVVWYSGPPLGHCHYPS